MSGPTQYGIYVWDGAAFVEATPHIRHLHASNEHLSKLHIARIGQDEDVAELVRAANEAADACDFIARCHGDEYDMAELTDASKALRTVLKRFEGVK